MNNLLDKVPTFLKPFSPQLQRTFAKSLADTSSELLRSRAAAALGTLLNLKPRIDPLIAELVTGTKTPDPGVRTAMRKALYEVVRKAGADMSETSRNAILGLIDGEVGDTDESMAITNARLLGALVKVLPDADAQQLIKHRALATKPSHASVLNLNALLAESPETIFPTFLEDTVSLITRGMALPQPAVADHFVLAGGKLMLLSVSYRLEDTLVPPILEALAEIIQPGASAPDTRRLALVAGRTSARIAPYHLASQRSALAPPIFASVRDPVLPVKLAAEAAFVALFDVVESGASRFDSYLANPDGGAKLSPQTKKSMREYFKRVATRLAAQAKERRDAEGGQGGLGLTNDEAEDEREIWSVGKVELGGVFEQDA